MDINLVQQLKEDVFQPITPEGAVDRDAEKEAKIKAKIAAWQEGKSLAEINRIHEEDTCPFCGGTDYSVVDRCDNISYEEIDCKCDTCEAAFTMSFRVQRSYIETKLVDPIEEL